MQTNSLHDEQIGRQEPRISLLRKGSNERAEDALDLADLMGMTFDPWQESAIRGMCAFDRPRWRWTHPEFGIVENRQNGKSHIFEVRVAGGLYRWGERSIMYTAHQFDAAVGLFNRVTDRIESTRVLSRKIKRIYTSNNLKQIILKSGQTATFKSRTRLSARSMTAETLIFDEAFALDPAQQAALRPILAALSKTGNIQTLYGSSAGQVASYVLADIRSRALAAAPGDRLGYIEHSIPGWHELTEDEREEWGTIEAYYGDPESHRLANPGWNIRIDPTYLVQEFTSMQKTSLTEFAREYLGVWDRPTGCHTVIDKDEWSALAIDKIGDPRKPLVAAIDVPPSRDTASIVFAWPLDDSRIYVELIDRAEGIGWVPARMKELIRKWHPDQIILKADGPAGQLLPSLQHAGITTINPSLTTYAAYCGDFLTRVKTGTISHSGQEELTDAVTGLAQRLFRDGEVFTWTRVDTLTDISPAIAATMAAATVSGIKPTRSTVPRRLDKPL